MRRFLDLGQTVVLRDLGDLARKGFRRVFQTHGAAIGAPWAPLKKATQRHRRGLIRKFGLKIGEASPILENFGDLRDAMTTLKHPAHEQFTTKHEVTLSVEQSRVNRHDRQTGESTGLTKRNQIPKKAKRVKRKKGKGTYAQYPDNIVDIHNEGLGDVPKREMIGVPREIEAEMDARVERHFDGVANMLLGGAEPR